MAQKYCITAIRTLQRGCALQGGVWVQKKEVREAETHKGGRDFLQKSWQLF